VKRKGIFQQCIGICDVLGSVATQNMGEENGDSIENTANKILPFLILGRGVGGECPKDKTFNTIIFSISISFRLRIF